jgi:hypothetical protein
MYVYRNLGQTTCLARIYKSVLQFQDFEGDDAGHGANVRVEEAGRLTLSISYSEGGPGEDATLLCMLAFD